MTPEGGRRRVRVSRDRRHTGRVSSNVIVRYGVFVGTKLGTEVLLALLDVGDVGLGGGQPVHLQLLMADPW